MRRGRPQKKAQQLPAQGAAAKKGRKERLGGEAAVAEGKNSTIASSATGLRRSARIAAQSKKDPVR